MPAAAVKSVLKRLAYGSGLLGAWHARRNRGALTVVMFHRVLAKADPRWRLADPGYTVSDTTFAASLDFFRRHYAVVDEAAVIAAARGGPALPPCPLLITFDDGWADNASAAAPILRGAGLPSLMFAVSDGIGRTHPFWWEVLTSARLLGRLDPAEMTRLWQAAGATGAPPPVDAGGTRRLIDALYRLDDATRAPLIAPLARLVAEAGEARQTVTAAELKALPVTGMAIGSHGASHTPLTEHPDPRADLALSRDRLGHLLGRPPSTVSFPNGRYDAAIARAAGEIGFELIFTSDPILNPLDNGRPRGPLLGRVYIEEGHVTDADGSFRPDLLALWLFPREILALR